MQTRKLFAHKFLFINFDCITKFATWVTSLQRLRSDTYGTEEDGDAGYLCLARNTTGLLEIYRKIGYKITLRHVLQCKVLELYGRHKEFQKFSPEGRLAFIFFSRLFVWSFCLENFSLILRRHHCRWRAANFNLCSSLMVFEQWGFFSMPHLLWHGSSVYNGHLRGPLTLTPIAERLTVKLKIPILTTCL